jgi:hypothetical protein
MKFSYTALPAGKWQAGTAAIVEMVETHLSSILQTIVKMCASLLVKSLPPTIPRMDHK